MKKYFLLSLSFVLLMFVSCSKPAVSNTKKYLKTIISIVQSDDKDSLKELLPFTKEQDDIEFELYYSVWKQIASSKYSLKIIPVSESLVNAEITLKSGENKGNTYSFTVTQSNAGCQLEKNVDITQQTKFIEVMSFIEED